MGRRPRAVMHGPFAMARPARPDGERKALLAAAAPISGGRSARDLGLCIARRVASEALSEFDRNPEDHLADALAELAAFVGDSPVRRLATCPAIDTAALIRRVRLADFEARGWRHLPQADWPRERERTLRAITAILARRYARLLRETEKRCP